MIAYKVFWNGSGRPGDAPIGEFSALFADEWIAVRDGTGKQVDTKRKSYQIGGSYETTLREKVGARGYYCFKTAEAAKKYIALVRDPYWEDDPINLALLKIEVPQLYSAPEKEWDTVTESCKEHIEEVYAEKFTIISKIEDIQ